MTTAAKPLDLRAQDRLAVERWLDEGGRPPPETVMRRELAIAKAAPARGPAARPGSSAHPR